MVWCCVQVAAMMSVLKAARALGLVDALDEVREAVHNCQRHPSKRTDGGLPHRGTACCRTCGLVLRLPLHALQPMPCSAILSLWSVCMHAEP